MEAFNWILPDRLAGSSLPGLLRDLESDLGFLRSVGIRHVVSLTRKPLVVPDPEGLEFHHLPITDMGIPTPRAAADLCRFVLERIDRDEPVLLHCKAGLGRTGLMLACCLISLGSEPEAAVVKLRQICSHYIQSQAQERFVDHFAEFLDDLEPEERPVSAPRRSPRPPATAEQPPVEAGDRRLGDFLESLAPAFDEVSNGVTLADARPGDAPLLYANRAFESMTGYAAADVLGRNCRFLQGPDTDPRAVARIREAIHKREPCHVCLKNYRQDGTPFLNELKILPVQGGAGTSPYFIGIQNDITSVLVARALYERFRAPQSAAGEPIEYLGYSVAVDLPISDLISPADRRADLCGVLVVDSRSRVCFANRLAADLLGRPPAALVSTSIFDHIDADWLSEALRPGSRDEHLWSRARLTASLPAQESAAELSTCRVHLNESEKPLYVILLRASAEGQ